MSNNQTFRLAYPHNTKRVVLLEKALAIVDELDLVQQLGERLLQERFSTDLVFSLSGYRGLDEQLANLTKLKNILDELKKCKENALQTEK